MITYLYYQVCIEVSPPVDFNCDRVHRRGFDLLPGKPFVEYKSGASYAVGIVAAVAALVWEADPSLSNIQVKEMIISTSRRKWALRGMSSNYKLLQGLTRFIVSCRSLSKRRDCGCIRCC